MKSNTRLTSNIKGNECLNCKQKITNTDNFCSSCGQVNDTKRLSLKQYITELLGSLFAFDTRTLNTFKLLLFNPGKVSKDYINGKRVKFVHPFKLYLHTSIIFFLIISLINVANDYSDIQSQKTKQPILKSDGESFSINLGSKKEEPKKKKINDIEIHSKITQSIDSIINNETFKNLFVFPEKKDKNLANVLFVEEIKDLHSNLEKDFFIVNDSLRNFNNFRTKYIQILEKNIKENKIDFPITNELYLDENDTLANFLLGTSFFKKVKSFEDSKTTNISKALDSLGFKRTRSNIFLFKKVKEFKNNDIFISKLISKSSITLFLMLPLFTLFLWFFYVRHNINYTEHLIFVFNIQTVFFIMLLLLFILNKVLDYKLGAILILTSSVFLIIKNFKAINNYTYHKQKATVLILYFLFVLYILSKTFDWSTSILVFLGLFSLYLYKAMRLFYNQGRRKTIAKFILLNTAFFFLMILGTAITMFLAFVI